MVAHGEYQQGRGWFDASLRVWLDHPSKITKVSSGQGRLPRPDLGAPVEQRAPLAERVAASAAARWQPNDELEQVRALRDSDLPERRAMAERMLRGTLRISLADYEAGLRAHLEQGGALPDGVQRP